MLLVEDSEDDLYFTRRALKACGLAPDRHATVRDDEEALDDLFARGDHAGRDLAEKARRILLALMLLKLSGLEVLERLRSDAHTMWLPVVVYSASIAPGEGARCYAAGANSFVRKPRPFEQSQTVLAQLFHYWMVMKVAPR